MDSRSLVKFSLSAEELGYDSVWAGERLLLSQRLEPLAALSVAATATESVRLGTAVMLAALRPPVLLAQQIASLDSISNGRVIIGVGAGEERIRREYESVQVPFNQRGRRLDECLRIMKLIWKGEPVTFEGRYYNIKDVKLELRPKQPNGPPIWIGGDGKRALRRVATLGDGWLPLGVKPKEYASSFAEIGRLATEKGRESSSIHRAFYMTLNMRAESEDARGEAHNWLNTYYNMIFSSIEKFGLFGTTDFCLKSLEGYASIDIETMMVRFASFDAEAQLKQFAKEIMPSF